MATETVRIQVLFTEKTPVGDFTDALYFSQADYAATPKSEIDSLKATRVANYVDAVQHPHAPVEPTLKELEDWKAELEKQLAEVIAKIEEK